MVEHLLAASIWLALVIWMIERRLLAKKMDLLRSAIDELIKKGATIRVSFPGQQTERAPDDEPL